MDSSMTSLRMVMRAVDWESEKPSERRRWTNFRVSKWWSRGREAVVAKARTGLEGFERMDRRLSDEACRCIGLWREENGRG